MKKQNFVRPQNIFEPNSGKNLSISVDGQKYFRLPIKTRLVTEKDDIMDLMKEYVAPNLKPGDIIFISEKVLCITQSRFVFIRDIKPSPLAKLLSSHVDNKRNTAEFRGFGHSTSRGMELLIRQAGYPRAIFAAAVSAVTRPLGIKGLFYFICGKMAKSIDCPMSFTLYPYLHYAKLAPLDPTGVAKKVKKEFGSDAVIVDANYIGVFSLGKSNGKISEKFIRRLLTDNPAGQAEEMTPFLSSEKTTLPRIYFFGAFLAFFFSFLCVSCWDIKII